MYLYSEGGTRNPWAFFQLQGHPDGKTVCGPGAAAASAGSMVPGKADPWELAHSPGHRTRHRRAQPSLRKNKTQAGHRIFLSRFPRDQRPYNKTQRRQSLTRNKALTLRPSGAQPGVDRKPREPSTKGQARGESCPLRGRAKQAGSRSWAGLHSASEHVTIVGDNVGRGPE